MRSLVIGGTVALALLNSSPVHAQAGDFGFRFSVGDCATITYDSFKGEFTRDLGGDPRKTVAIPLSLTDAQMSVIYWEVERVRFFDLPTPYSGVRSGLLTLTMFHPSNTYQMEVRNGGVVHTITWEHNTGPTTPEADRLLGLFQMIQDVVLGHPDVQRLPKGIGGCE
jgi:hypothetical protein